MKYEIDTNKYLKLNLETAKKNLKITKTFRNSRRIKETDKIDGDLSSVG